MKTTATILLLVAFCVCIHAQDKRDYCIDRYLISPYGLSSSNSNYVVSSSVGDVVVDFLKAGDSSTLTQGFQQALIKPEEVINKDLFIAYRPNPVKSTLRLQFKTEADYIVEIFTITGSKVLQKKVYNKNFEDIDCRSLRIGLYMVKVSSSDKQLVVSFKISKV